jgi:hypothetical protein
MRGRAESVMHLQRGDLMVSWVNLGEGYSGEYRDGADDRELLRFDVAVRAGSALASSLGPGDVAWASDDGAWLYLTDGSYCTLIGADSSEATQRAALELLMDQVAPAVEQWHWKKRCEALSWIEPAWLAANEETTR